MTVKSEPRYYICLVESFVQKKNSVLKLKKLHREKNAWGGAVNLGQSVQ